MTRPSNFTPKSELTISPNSLISYINELLKEIIFEILPYNIEIPEKLIEKNFKKKIQNSRIWKGILSSDRCMYIYTENSKKCFTLCNRQILRDTNIDEPINYKENKYFCSNHIKGQDISCRKRKFKDPNIKYCCKFNKNNKPCGNTAILAGNICKEHWKKENGHKKHDKVQIPEYLYLKNNTIDFSSNSWYEYRKYIENYNNQDEYYEKIIENLNTSENLLLKYLNPAHLTRILENKKYNSDNKKQEILLKRKKKISNYCLDNIYKKTKFNCEKVEDIFLNYKFSFKYTIKDYYIENINKNNRKLLNKILIYIIDIRNIIHINNYYKNNKTYKDILKISNKILEII